MALFAEVPSIGFFESLRSLRLHLWDEGRKQLVGFGHVRQLKRSMQRDRALSA